MSIPGTSTNQQSTGSPVIRSQGADGNFMAWTGLSPGYPNISTAPAGTYVFPQGPNKTLNSAYGPAFVVLPSGNQAYYIWADSSTKAIKFSQITRNADGSWSWGTPVNVPGSQAAGAPTAMLDTQNGQLCVNVIWQDSGKNSMVLLQIYPFLTQTSYPFAALGKVCVDAPTLAKVGQVTYLAYFDTNKNFNLAAAVGGALNFNFAGQFTSTTVNSSYQPAVVSISSGLGYLLWTSSTKTLNYAQLGFSALRVAQFNPTAGCSGVIAGATPAAGPTAQLVAQVDASGVTTNNIVVGWPDVYSQPYGNTVYTTTIAPNYAPIPL
jgi:hypothetical protein